MISLDDLPVEKWLEMNAKLQKKKSDARKELADMGVIEKDKKNQHYGYSYLSESGYKRIFTNLFSKHGLEMKSDEIEYHPILGMNKSSIGRMVRIRFTLFDVETGFYESTEVTGEGLDQGDKAGYKAFTGSLKYYLATTFMVATGDDAERDEPISKEQISFIVREIDARKESVKNILYICGVKKIEEMTYIQANALIKFLGENHPNVDSQSISQDQKPTPKLRMINKKQINILKIKYQGKEEALQKVLEKAKVQRIEDLTQEKAVKLLDAINRMEMDKNESVGN